MKKNKSQVKCYPIVRDLGRPVHPSLFCGVLMPWGRDRADLANTVQETFERNSCPGLHRLSPAWGYRETRVEVWSMSKMH